MLVCNTISEIRAFVREARSKGRSIGFVPTMGYLHEGHLELMRRAKERCDTVVISIFVNPTQFGPNEDYDRYPRDLERDARLAGQVGVDAIFNPSVEEMYPAGYCTYVDVERLTGKLCGLSRPGHFRGVCTVVTKLFNIVKPDYAFFGQKDAQQALVIKRMAADLNMDLEVITVPTVREADGLAMSSRNVYLDPEQRRAALVLSRSLEKAGEAFRAGERDASKLRQMVLDMIKAEPLANIDYVEIYSYPELEPLDQINGPALLALAVKIGQTRLIDNAILGQL
ncbi:panthothenate synthetase [Pelotomaculum thermopropionicum SI]|uniref:Pantothenate synthetase n=1 Tax=Pelotomaculum thermopropionicum (strain DSM 13744 / JCM 10971 / SI) TaxID=370438 RepID=PANC_PELTS|nr:RecName: Full=Pantothenate synthetase; Short=PS; AltName: Full=Pantoate--beta-alanine ligase; AltName: Full=Pantoate-activating enzyme [Pelotomaculum thermopropionicum SI]BAF58402.1 panthothenate synthetase [Pelotomaculum thermopropionicum SI]